MAVWALQDAKAKFSEVVERALTEGPQHVTRHGRPVVVITAEPLAPPQPTMSFGAFLLTMPQSDVDFVFENSRFDPAEIDFGDAD